MKFKHFLLRCDLLGKTQNFTIAQRNSFHTPIGVILSFIMVTVIVYFFGYFFIKGILMKNPMVVITNHIDENPPKISLTNESYIITISLQNPDYSVYVNESIYTVNLTLLTIIRLGNGTVETIEEPLQLIRCNQFNFIRIPEYFNLMDVDNLYCINTTKEIYLRGSFGQPEWTYLNFEFNKCVNSTLNQNSCVPEEEMNKILDGGYVGLFVTDFSVYPNDLKKPFHLYGRNIFTGFSVREYLECWIYLNQIEINTDNGIVLERIQTSTSFQYESLKELKDHRSGNNFLTVGMRLAQSKDIYDRTYTKLHESIADFGGIIKVVFLLGEIVTYLFRELLYKDYILGFFYEKMTSNNNGNDSQTFNRSHSRISLNCRKSDYFYKMKRHTINNSLMSSSHINAVRSPKKNIKCNSFYSHVLPIPDNNFTLAVFQKRAEQIGKNTQREFSKSSSFETKNHQIIHSNVIDEQHVKNNNFLINTKQVNENDTWISIDSKKKQKHLRHKRNLNWYLLLGPCLFNRNIQKNIKEVNDKYKRVFYWFDVIHYLKQNNDLMYIKQILFSEHQFQRIKNKYLFELSPLNDINIFHSRVEKSIPVP